MIRFPHGGGNIESTMTATMAAASRYLVTHDGIPEELPKLNPPQVLITPEHVRQMRERKRQLQALQEWSAQLVSDGGPQS